MCALFAATHPERTLALVMMGAFARRIWAPDYPIGRAPEQDGWLRPDRRGVGALYAAERFLAERAPSIAGDDEAIAWYTSYLVRGASPAAVGRSPDERGDRRPPVLPTIRVPTLVLYREREYLREATRYMGERHPGRAGRRAPGRRPPAVGGRPGGSRSARSRRFSKAPATIPPATACSPPCSSSGRPTPEEACDLVRADVARFRGRELAAHRAISLDRHLRRAGPRDPVRAVVVRRGARHGNAGPCRYPHRRVRRRRWCVDRDRRSMSRARSSTPSDRARPSSRRPCVTSWPGRGSRSPTGCRRMICRRTGGVCSPLSRPPCRRRR